MWRGERQTLMPFTANMIFTTEQQAQSTEVKECAYIYKKAHMHLTLSFLHPFRTKKIIKKSLQLQYIFCESIACNTIGRSPRATEKNTSCV